MDRRVLMQVAEGFPLCSREQGQGQLLSLGLEGGLDLRERAIEQVSDASVDSGAGLFGHELAQLLPQLLVLAGPLLVRLHQMHREPLRFSHEERIA